MFAVRSNIQPGQPVCQYNEDCPPDKACDRLNRLCINPCSEDSCGENAECWPDNHQVQCRCLPGSYGNPYIECGQGECHATTPRCVTGTAGRFENERAFLLQ